MPKIMTFYDGINNSIAIIIQEIINYDTYVPFRANLLYPFQYETPCISHNEKRPHQFLIFFFEILVIVQGGKNMLGELAMDNLVIMSAFDNLMKVLEILQKEGINCL